MGHGGPVLYLLMFIQTCNVMWQRNKAFNISAVCTTHKRLKLFSNKTHASTSITSACSFYVTAFTCNCLPVINDSYAGYKKKKYQHCILTSNSDNCNIYMICDCNARKVNAAICRGLEKVRHIVCAGLSVWNSITC